MNEKSLARRQCGLPCPSCLLWFGRNKVRQAAAGCEQGAERKVQGNVRRRRFNFGNHQMQTEGRRAFPEMN